MEGATCYIIEYYKSPEWRPLSQLFIPELDFYSCDLQSVLKINSLKFLWLPRNIHSTQPALSSSFLLFFFLNSVPVH